MKFIPLNMKSIFASKTFWGAMSGLIVALFAIFDIKVADDEAQQIAEAIGAVVSTILVIWGRATATERVTLGKPDGTAMILLCLLIPLVAGCTHHWPKDSYIQGGSSTINTPWGSSIQKIQVLATGKAAEAISKNPPPTTPVESAPSTPPTTSSRPPALNDTP